LHKKARYEFINHEELKMTKYQYELIRKHLKLAIRGEPMPSITEKSSQELGDALLAYFLADDDKFMKSRIAIGALACSTLMTQLARTGRAESDFQKVLALGRKPC
jgi:hypothetical protein